MCGYLKNVLDSLKGEASDRRTRVWPPFQKLAFLKPRLANGTIWNLSLEYDSDFKQSR